jgi:protein-L-isoaspartate O-methyltransferase
MRLLSAAGERLSTIKDGEFMRALFSILLLGALPLAAQSEGDKLAPYYPTPETIVEKMLQLGGLKAGEKMFDLGSGDGRIVIMAAQKFHAEAVGVELDRDLCRQSLARIQKLGLDKAVRIVNGDLLKQNYSSADLVTVYLLPESIDNKVLPLLEKQLKKGARVVAHDFEFKAWKPEKVENIADDGEGRSHTLYLYRK